MAEVRVEVTRGGRTESVHGVTAAVIDAGGVARLLAGNVDESVFTRSAIKPFQALPLAEDGVVERWGLTSEELALCCASHSGEPRHVDVARSILRRAGLEEDALACGPHMPFNAAAARALREAGASPGRIHNNCSGKHAGMLALARSHDWPVEGYQGSGHPVQERVARVLGEWTGVAPDRMDRGVDGCGVVTFALPVRALAAGFARLSAAAAVAGSPAGMVLGAMADHPHMVGGEGRLCTRLSEVTGGRVVAKVGAEGVYGAAVREGDLGVAIKVADGAKRAAEVALLGILDTLGLLRAGEKEALRDAIEPAVENTRGERVGEVRAVVELGHHG